MKTFLLLAACLLVGCSYFRDTVAVPPPPPPPPADVGPYDDKPKEIVIDGVKLVYRSGYFFDGTNVPAMFMGPIGDEYILADTTETRDGVVWKYDPRAKKWEATDIRPPSEPTPENTTISKEPHPFEIRGEK